MCFTWCTRKHLPNIAELFRLLSFQSEILKEERAALRSSLRGTSCTSSSRYSPQSPSSTSLGSPKSSRLVTTGSPRTTRASPASSSTTPFSNGATSWKHVESPGKHRNAGSTEPRSCASMSPTTRAKFGAGPSAARGPFASRYNDFFSNFGSGDSTSPGTSPKHSTTTDIRVSGIRNITAGGGAGAKSSTLTAVTMTSQRSARYGLGPRSSTLPPGLEFHSRRRSNDSPPSPRGGREKVQETLKVEYHF